MASRRFGWHSGSLNCRDVTVSNDLTIQGDLDFGDAVTDTLSVTGLFKQGTSSSEITLTEGTPLFSFYATCASTSGSTSAEGFYVKHTMTGAGGVGGRAKFVLSAEAALGGWANALKAETTFDSSGSVTGLGSCIATDLTLSAGTSSGSYAAFEGNIIAGSGASTGTKTSFFALNAAGADADTVDSNAYLIAFGAEIDAASGKFVDTDKTSEAAYGGIRVYIEGVGTKYLRLFDAA